MLQLRVFGPVAALESIGRELDTDETARGVAITASIRPGDAVLTGEVSPEAADAVLALISDHGVRADDVALVAPILRASLRA